LGSTSDWRWRHCGNLKRLGVRGIELFVGYVTAASMDVLNGTGLRLKLRTVDLLREIRPCHLGFRLNIESGKRQRNYSILAVMADVLEQWPCGR